MSAAQLLLRRLLEQSGGPAESGYLLVIDGEGLEDLPQQLSTPRGTCGVHRVSTEIGLRHLLWKAQGAPLIAVLPEELARRIQKVPDLLRRARKQRVHALSANDVLEVILGVRVVGAETPYMQELALEHVERLGQALSRRTLPTVVDRKLLTELLVDVSVGERVRTRPPAELLAGWLREPPRWTDNVSLLVREALPALHGDEGRVLSWALAQPDRRLRELVIHGALLTVEGEDLPKQVWGPLWQAAVGPPLDMDRRILRRTVTRLSEDALAAMGDAAAGLLAEADGLGRVTLSAAQLQTSRVLPLALLDRCDALARQAAAGKVISAEDISWLTSHRAAGMHRSELAVLEALARLSRYLDLPWAPAGDVVKQVRAYQQDGAFADLAALHLRRALASSAHHHAEAEKVLAAVRERRDRENRAFAETLAAGYEAALHRDGLTPLHRLWRRVVAPLWQEQPGGRIYLVVLDGCSYPVFLELLYALSQDSSFPLGIRPDADGRVAGLPALAPLPTMTSHARGALFLGELPGDPLVAETVFRDQEEGRTDKARFRQNAALQGRNCQLLLKGDLADGGQALLRALGDQTMDVVAAVFNAVDDQIGSDNTGAVVRLLPEDIRGFKPSLRAALQAGRRVLLTADHGHSPFVDRSLRMGAGKTPRYLALAQNEAPPEGFGEIDLKGLGGPPERRAFAWRSGVYLGGAQVGFHGGCSLEEMVVPLAWIEKEGLHADEPSWWYGRGAVPEPLPVARPVAPPILTPVLSDPVPARGAGQGQGQGKPTPQLSLFAGKPGERAEQVLGLPAEVLARLGMDERAVLVLLKENGSARASELAVKLGKNPGRLNGLMRVLKRTLHEAGLRLFTDEELPSGEILYRDAGTKEGT